MLNIHRWLRNTGYAIWLAGFSGTTDYNLVWQMNRGDAYN